MLINEKHLQFDSKRKREYLREQREDSSATPIDKAEVILLLKRQLNLTVVNSEDLNTVVLDIDLAR